MDKAALDCPRKVDVKVNLISKPEIIKFFASRPNCSN